jgi:sec-independent protein translocase protein TatC
MKVLQPDEKIPFTEHLEELRKRLLIIIAAVGVGFVISYYFAGWLVELIRRPLGRELIFIAPTEAFFINLKLAFFAGIVLAAPIILFQTWCFIAPGLLEKEKKFTFPIVISSTIFFLLGCTFAYFIILPIGTQFFLSFATQDLRPMISLSNYFSFSVKLILAFGIVFQLPVAIFFLSKLGILRSKTLRQNRRYAILAVFTVAAILTPPDVVSQIMIAIPLLLLYEGGIWVARMVERKREGETDSAESNGNSG